MMTRRNTACIFSSYINTRILTTPSIKYIHLRQSWRWRSSSDLWKLLRHKKISVAKACSYNFTGPRTFRATRKCSTLRRYSRFFFFFVGTRDEPCNLTALSVRQENVNIQEANTGDFFLRLLFSTKIVRIVCNRENY